MDIYLKKKRWKILLFLGAILIGLASLLYTNWLTDKLSQEERKKVELWAEAIKRLARQDGTYDPRVISAAQHLYATSAAEFMNHEGDPNAPDGQ